MHVRKQRRAENDRTVLVLFELLVIYLELEFWAHLHCCVTSQTVSCAAGGADECNAPSPPRDHSFSEYRHPESCIYCIQAQHKWRVSGLP